MPTYKLFKKAYEGLDDFEPITQDKFAIAIFKDVKALGFIQSGDLKKVFKKLNTEKSEQFSSLPGATQSHGLTMQRFMEIFKSKISNELNNKSDLATPAPQMEETIKSVKKKP